MNDATADPAMRHPMPANGPGDRLLGWIEVLDRDGQPRQSLAVTRWPLRIGRSLDNDLVLSDAHVAAHHLALERNDAGLVVAVGETRNGLRLGRRTLHGGEQATLVPGAEPIDLLLGRSHLRLRLPGQPVAPELALAADGSYARRTLPMLLAALLLVAGTLFGAYLGADPDDLARAAGTALFSAVLAAAVWCTAWALLTKMFTRQARFGWHLRVFLYAMTTLMAINAVGPLLAFMFSWPWASGGDSYLSIVVLGMALYFHLLAVEPARRRTLKWTAATCMLVAGSLMLWINLQRTGHWRDELYMSHLFPPALRLASPVPTQRYVNDLGALKATLDRKARESGGEDDPRVSEDE